MKKLFLALLCATSYLFSAEQNCLYACRNTLISYRDKASTRQDAKSALTAASTALLWLASLSPATHIPSQTHIEVPIAGRPKERALYLVRKGYRQLKEALGADAAHLPSTFLSSAETVITEAFLARPDFTKPTTSAALKDLLSYSR